MKSSSSEPDATGRDFAAWLNRELTARGYDLTGPRSGGKSAFAKDSGLSSSTVGRLTRGESVTDTRVLGLLAEALHVSLGEVLVRAGVLSADQLTAVQHPEAGERRITPEQAATELGITDEQQRALFIAMTHTLRRQRPPGAAEGEGQHLA